MFLSQSSRSDDEMTAEPTEHPSGADDNAGAPGPDREAADPAPARRRRDDSDIDLSADERAEAEHDADTELLHRILASDESAFEEIVRRFENRLRNHAYRMLGDRPGAEDVAQEVLIAFFSGLARMMPVRNLAALLYRMTTNRCLNVLRSRSRRREVMLDPQGTGMDSTGPIAPVFEADVEPVEAQMSEQEAERLVFEALDGLPPRQRAAWVLKVVEQRPYAEIAEILQTTVGNCEVLVHRAGKRLAASPALRRYFRP
jgi:RNA polymerase sigma-70 factor (ECF subfamily)